MYYIYHIPGIKVGCTNNMYLRNSRNKLRHGKDIEIIELEKVDCPVTADILEYYLHKELGYGVIPPNERYMARRKVGSKNKNRVVSSKTKNKIAKSLKGKTAGSKNGNYGSGKVFIELTTGYKGTFTEVAAHFDCNKASLAIFAKRGKVIQKGKHEGLHFQILEP